MQYILLLSTCEYCACAADQLARKLPWYSQASVGRAYPNVMNLFGELGINDRLQVRQHTLHHLELCGVLKTLCSKRNI